MVFTAKAIFGKKQPSAQPLSRLQKLKIAREVLGQKLPSALQKELTELALEPAPGVPFPSAEPPIASHTPEPPIGQPPAEATTGEETPEKPPPDAPPPAPEKIDTATSKPVEAKSEINVRRLGKNSGLGAFLTFENVIFLLSAILILGGTLYFAAVTWGHVPGRWQHLFLETITAFCGALLLLGARLLASRLQLTSASQFLSAIAAAVAVICSVIAASAFSANGVAGLLGAVVASTLALVACHTFLRLTDQPTQPSWFFALAVLLVALCGTPASVDSSAAAGITLLAATVVSCVLFAQRLGLNWMVFALTASIPAAGFLLAIPGHIPLYTAAPGLAALTWFGLELRQGSDGNSPWRWGGLAAALLALICMVLALPNVGALTAVALVATVGCLRSSSRCHQGDTAKPSLVAAAAAGLLWVFISAMWAPAIGLMFPRAVIDWLVDLVTQPGEQVSASWDGLAALPCLAAAWYLSHYLAKKEDRRKLVAEVTAWGVLSVSSLLTMVTFDRQPVPSGIVLALLAATTFIWARHKGSAPRYAPAHVLLLLAAFSLTFAFSQDYAFITAALLAVFVLGAALPTKAGQSGRAVATFTVPILVTISLLDGEVLTTIPGILLLCLGVVQLWQPGSAQLNWLRPFGPLSLLYGLAALLLYAPYSSDAPVDDLYTMLVLATGVAAVAIQVAFWQRPLFLYVEVVALSILVGAVALLVALDDPIGTHQAVVNGIASLIALLSLLLASRRYPQYAPYHWLLAMLAIPLPAATLFDQTLAWPGAVFTAICAALLSWRSRRDHLAWLATCGFSQGLLAALWATMAIATLFSTGGGQERVLTALATVTALYGAALLLWGRKISAAGPKLVQVFAIVCLGTAMLFGLLGVIWVDQPKIDDIVLAIVTMLTVAGFSLLLAIRSRAGWPIYFCETAIIAVYIYLRGRTDLLDWMQSYDGVCVAAGAFLFLALSRFLARRQRPGQQPEQPLGVSQSRNMAMLLPALIPVVMEWQGGLGDSFAAALGGLLYSMLARQNGKMRFGWLAALLFNLILIPIWIRMNIESPMVYLLPVGLSLMFLARFYREQLSKTGPWIRTLAAILVLGSTSIESFEFDSLLPALALAALSIGAVLLGIVWRLRAYLYSGFAFLVLDIVVNLTRWGMQDRFIAGVLGVVSGLALFTLGVLVARHKQMLLTRYQKVRTWQW